MLPRVYPPFSTHRKRRTPAFVASALALLSVSSSFAQVYTPATQAGDVYTAIPATPNIVGSGMGTVNGVLDATAPANYTITINSGVNIFANSENPGSAFPDSIVLGDGTHLVTVDGQITAGNSGLGVFGLNNAVTTLNVSSTGSVSAPTGTGATLRGGGVVNNAGAITGSSTGVFYNVVAGSVNNMVGGTISGAIGVRYFAGGSLGNAGQINGSVQFVDNASIDVTLFTGGTIAGDLDMSANTAAKLTLDGAGTQLYSTAVTGATTFAGSLTKQGTGTWTLDTALAYTGDTLIEGGTLVVTEDITNTPNVYVGYSNPNSHLRIASGGTITTTSSTIGVESDNNTATVTGTSSAWINSGSLNVGYEGSDNLLTIEAGGLIGASSAAIGGLAAGDGNRLVVTGTGSALSNSGNISVGYEGSANSLEISAAGTVVNADAFVGWAANSNDNLVTVSGTGSLWSSSGTFHLGNDGSGNEVRISNGGAVIVLGPAQDALIGFNSGSNNNKLVVTGSNSIFANDATLYVGNNGSGNSLEVSDLGFVSTENARIGGGAGSNNNTATVDGGTWVNSGTLRVGSNGSSNELIIKNSGGVAVTGNSFVGYSATSQNNTIHIQGGVFSAGTLTVGRDGAGNRVVVTDNGALVVANGITLAANAGSSGTLVLGEGGTPGYVSSSSITGGLGAAEILINHNVDPYYLSPNLIGNLSVRSIGSGTTFFSGSNTYTEGTTVTGGGYIAITNADDLGTGNITLNNGGIQWSLDPVDLSGRINPLGAGGGLFKLFIDRVTFASPLTGKGSITLSGGGNLILKAKNTYQGETFVTEGTLTTAVDGALPEKTDLVLGSRNSEASTTVDLKGTKQQVNSISTISKLKFPVINFITSTGGSADLVARSTTTDSVFAGKITGNVAVHKEGKGTSLTLLGDQTYTAGTFVKEGSFILGDQNTESSLEGDVTVSEGAFFGGTGTIGGSLINAGVFSPGYSPGTMVINNDFTLESTSLLAIEIASKENYDRIIVNGKAKLGGTLRLQLLGGYVPEPGDEFELITARRITGKFKALEQASGGLFELVLQGNQLLLVWAADARLPYQNYAQTQNQYNVAVALEQLRNSGESGDFNKNIRPVLDTLPPNGLVQAFEAIMPSQSIAFSQTTFARSKTWLPQMQTRLADARARNTTFTFSERGAADMKNVMAPEVNKWSAWLDGGGVFSQTAGFDGLRTGDGSAATATVGGDYRLSDNFTVGVYTGYIGTWTDFGGGSEVDSNGTRFGIYSTYQNGGFYLNNLVGGEWNSYDWNRRINFPGINRRATADTQGTVFETMFGGGYDWKVCDWATVGAFSALEYTLLNVDEFTETGAGALNLRVRNQDADSLRTNLGMQFAGEIPINNRVLRPSLRAAWRHEYLDGNRRINSTLAGGAGPGFSTVIPGGNRKDSLLLNGGVAMDLTDNVAGYVYYTGDLGADAVENVHSVNAGLRLSF